MSELVSDDTKASPAEGCDQAARLVREALRGLQFGTVTLIVQDGLVIQVDRTERTRVRREPKKS